MFEYERDVAAFDPSEYELLPAPDVEPAAPTLAGA
jgi:hypothetical protein